MGVEYLAVCGDNLIEIFNVMARCKVRDIPFNGMFQSAFRAGPFGRQFFMHERFVQESYVGYKYGSYFRLGLICKRTRPEDYPAADQQDEEVKMEVDELSGG